MLFVQKMSWNWLQLEPEVLRCKMLTTLSLCYLFKMCVCVVLKFLKKIFKNSERLVLPSVFFPILERCPRTERLFFTVRWNKFLPRKRPHFCNHLRNDWILVLYFSNTLKLWDGKIHFGRHKSRTNTLTLGCYYNVSASSSVPIMTQNVKKLHYLHTYVKT